MVLYAAIAEPPSWTDKLEAWSTFGGAIFTAIAVIVAFLVWRHDQRVRREDKLNAETAQARLVINKVVAVIGSREEGWQVVAYEVHNNSAGRITELHTALFLSDGSMILLDAAVGDLGPGEQHEGQVQFGEPASWQFAVRSYGGPPTWTSRIVLGVDMQSRFVDSSGVRWFRDNDQEPRQSLRPPYRSTWFLLAEYLYINTAIFHVLTLAKRPVSGLRLRLHKQLGKRAERGRRPNRR